MADGGLYVDRISMNEKHGKRGQWIGFFYLTLSDISAEILNWIIKQASQILTTPVYLVHSTSRLFSRCSYQPDEMVKLCLAFGTVAFRK